MRQFSNEFCNEACGNDPYQHRKDVNMKKAAELASLENCIDKTAQALRAT